MSFERIKSGIVEYRSNGHSDRGYMIGSELAEALNVALLLERPLLVTGEPGTGKSMLARAVAQQLGLGFQEFTCKSTSVARDLFYYVDHLRRLYDAYHPSGNNLDAERYVTFSALGRAILASEPEVVLIDEIDKAPTDFPNDLLTEIARAEFVVPEINPDHVYKARQRPIVIITSNSERQLPLPFLRRCTYFDIAFPTAPVLHQIVALQTGSLQLPKALIETAVQRFMDVRARPGLMKKPATDELVAWTRVLHALGVDATKLEKLPLSELPGMTALIKSREDRDRLS